MREYALLKLIEMAGKIDSRKRIQKTSYVLQQLGYPLPDRFIWHHFGPYSHELAALLDELVSLGFVDQEQQTSRSGHRFRYALTADGHLALSNFEKGERGQTLVRTFTSVFEKLQQIVDAAYPLRTLELGASLLYWRHRAQSEDAAAEIVSKSKGAPRDSRQFKEAMSLAAQW